MQFFVSFILLLVLVATAFSRSITSRQGQFAKVSYFTFLGNLKYVKYSDNAQQSWNNTNLIPRSHNLISTLTLPLVSEPRTLLVSQSNKILDDFVDNFLLLEVNDQNGWYFDFLG